MNNRTYLDELILASQQCNYLGCRTSADAYASRVFDLMQKESQEYQKKLIDKYKPFFDRYKRREINPEWEMGV